MFDAPEEFKNQRNEARTQLQQARLQVIQSDKGNDLQIKAKSQASLAQAAGRFFSALAIIIILGMVVYSVYVQNTMSSAAAAETLRNIEFQKRTEEAIRGLQIKPVPPPPKTPKRVKKDQPTDSSKGDKLRGANSDVAQ
jgi:hypothetical protein